MRLMIFSLILMVAFSVAVNAQELSIKVDGVLDNAEWGAVAEAPPGTPATIATREDDRYLYIAIRSNIDSALQIYLANDSVLHILHAGEALGQATYRREGDTAYLEQPYRFQAYDPEVRHREGNVIDIETEQMQNLIGRGWVANTTHMGPKGEWEIVIAKYLLEEMGGNYLIGYGWDDGSGTRQWRYTPDYRRLLDFGDEIELLRGDAPQTLTLVPIGWEQE